MTSQVLPRRRCYGIVHTRTSPPHLPQVPAGNLPGHLPGPPRSPAGPPPRSPQVPANRHLKGPPRSPLGDLQVTWANLGGPPAGDLRGPGRSSLQVTCADLQGPPAGDPCGPPRSRTCRVPARTSQVQDLTGYLRAPPRSRTCRVPARTWQVPDLQGTCPDLADPGPAGYLPGPFR